MDVLTVVIPAYKPDERLMTLVRALDMNHLNVVVVDDASGPHYRSYFDAFPPDVTVLRHAQNHGKGAAIKTALSHIQDRLAHESGIVIADADGQHSVEDILNVCARQQQRPDCLVLGVRRFTGRVPLRSRVGNKLTGWLFRLFTGVPLSDTQTGLRAFPVSWIPWLLECPGARYEYEMNVLSLCARRRLPISEVAIETIYENGANKSSHFRPIRDSLLVYRGLLLFSGSSLICFVVDYLFFLAFLACTAPMPAYFSSLILSNILARIISSTLNFSLNRWIFKSRAPLLISAAKYALLAGCILAANCVLLQLLCTALYIPRSIAKLVTELLLFCLSYIAQQRYVFRETDSKEDASLTDQEAEHL